jgi:hypothetical protein
MCRGLRAELRVKARDFRHRFQGRKRCHYLICGRYDNLIARDAYRALYRAGRLPASNFPLRDDIAPTDPIPIVRIDPRDGEREVTMVRWGLKEKLKVPHINARGETVRKLPLFREAFAKRRCLIPATGFYEEGANCQPFGPLHRSLAFPRSLPIQGVPARGRSSASPQPELLPSVVPKSAV